MLFLLDDKRSLGSDHLSLEVELEPSGWFLSTTDSFAITNHGMILPGSSHIELKQYWHTEP
jgi:hypothetical protein